MKIAIIGTGVTGGALSRYIEEETQHSVMQHDPPKGVTAAIEFCEAAFICVPVPTLSDGTQDYSNIEQYKGLQCPVFVRSTILPDYASKLPNDWYHVPEFLTERRSHADMNKQDIVCSGAALPLLKNIFTKKKFIVQESERDCALVKYAHNCFGAMKVNFFNHIFNRSDNYNLVKKGFLSTGYINKNHTDVPGPDGRFGFGGNCFLKDIYAFADFTEVYSLRITITENNIHRKRIIKDA